MKIVKATILKKGIEGFYCENEVHVELEDGSKQRLFRYFPDELYFHADEFIGLTVDQAIALRTKRDVAYLRS